MIRIDNEPDEPSDGIPLRPGTIAELMDAIDRLAAVLGAEPEYVIGPLVEIIDRRAALERLRAGPGLRVVPRR
jgi:hypothetical protein